VVDARAYVEVRMCCGGGRACVLAVLCRLVIEVAPMLVLVWC